MRIHRTELMAMRTAPKLRPLAQFLKLCFIRRKPHPIHPGHMLHRKSFGERVTRGQKMSFAAVVGTLYERCRFAELRLTEDRFNSGRMAVKLR